MPIRTQSLERQRVDPREPQFLSSVLLSWVECTGVTEAAGAAVRLPEKRLQGEWEDVLGGAQQSRGVRPRWAWFRSTWTDPTLGVLEEYEMRQGQCCQEGSGV